MLVLSAKKLEQGKFIYDCRLTLSLISGPRGILRFESELSKPENKGIQFAMDQIEEIKEDGNHITALLSYSDLIQLGGYTAVEYCGGPVMIFKMGREDAEDSEVNPHDRLPDANEARETILSKMLRMGFTKQDFVAIMGSHTLGFAHQDRSGFKGRWTQNPHVFDNSYYKEVLLGDRSKFLQTQGERMLI